MTRLLLVAHSNAESLLASELHIWLLSVVHLCISNKVSVGSLAGLTLTEAHLPLPPSLAVGLQAWPTQTV